MILIPDKTSLRKVQAHVKTHLELYPIPLMLTISYCGIIRTDTSYLSKNRVSARVLG